MSALLPSMADTPRLTRRTLQAAREQPLGAFGAVVLVVMAVLAIGAPWIAPYDPTEGNAALLERATQRCALAGHHLFGRDMLSRLIHGARVSLLVGLGASLLGVCTGAAIGLVTSYRGGWADTIAQRLMDALLAFPMLLLALALAAVLGPSLPNVIVALSLPIVPRAARIARSSVLVLKASPLVEAAIVAGCSDLRIIVRHILPNTFAPLLVIATAYLGLAIVQEAALDYLGAGIQEPHPSWGLMMAGPATSLALTAPWVVVFPGLAICLTVLASNLLGDAIRDLTDPRLRGR